jgi:hypothetical protein
VAEGWCAVHAADIPEDSDRYRWLWLPTPMRLTWGQAWEAFSVEQPSCEACLGRGGVVRVITWHLGHAGWVETLCPACHGRWLANTVDDPTAVWASISPAYDLDTYDVEFWRALLTYYAAHPEHRDGEYVGHLTPPQRLLDAHPDLAALAGPEPTLTGGA